MRDCLVHVLKAFKITLFGCNPFFKWSCFNKAAQHIYKLYVITRWQIVLDINSLIFLMYLLHTASLGCSNTMFLCVNVLGPYRSHTCRVKPEIIVERIICSKISTYKPVLLKFELFQMYHYSYYHTHTCMNMSCLFKC